MTGGDNERADLERAARKTAESRRLAEEAARHSQEHAREALSWAAVLRRLREENGFQAIFEEAFGGRHG
jgi:hypothetical protein